MPCRRRYIAGSPRSPAADLARTERRTAITAMARMRAIRIASPRICASDTIFIPGSSPLWPVHGSDVIMSGGQQLSPGPAELGLGLGRVAALGLRALVRRPRPGDVDLVGQLRVLGKDRHPVLGHREETAVHRDSEHVAVRFHDSRGKT